MVVLNEAEQEDTNVRDDRMRFSRLHLENWRNFRYVNVFLQERVFLIGANGTGKSNLLDVFRFLQDIVRVGGGFEKAVNDRGGILHIRSLVAPDAANVVIDVHIADGVNEVWQYHLAFTEDVQHRPILTEEKAWKAGELVLDRPGQQDAADEELLYQTSLEQKSANREFREIADFFNSIRYYHIVPQFVREPERSPRVTFDPYGRDLIARMADLPKKTQNTRLQLIQRALRAAVPQLQELKIDIDKSGVPHLQGRFEHWQTKGVWQTEVDFSDGMLRLIGLLWALLEEAGPLLLEEPEIFLHQDVIRHIPGMMAYLLIGHHRQILLSTHSEDMLRNEGIAPDEVLILQPTFEGTKAELGLEIDVVKQLVEAGLTIAEAALPSTNPPDTEKISFLGE